MKEKMDGVEREITRLGKNGGMNEGRKNTRKGIGMWGKHNNIKPRLRINLYIYIYISLFHISPSLSPV